jgi:hypothetical protein
MASRLHQQKTGERFCMDSEMNLSDAYRIEVSGWSTDGNFFAEQTDLQWSPEGEKKISLHHELYDGAIVFVRLRVPVSISTSIPVAYQVHSVNRVGSNGLREMRLTQVHPRSRESIGDQIASKLQEESHRNCEATESPKVPELEEILQ